MKHTILVTGANGQLGREMRRVSTQSANRYLFTDVAELDITQAAAVDKMVLENRVDVIVNCAAYTHVDQAEDDYLQADLLNHQAVENLALAAHKAQATLIHISTDYVFSGNYYLPYREESPTDPLGVYGKTKLAGEESIRSVGCKYLILRTSWLYSSFGKNFVKTMRKLTAERDVIQVVFDQVGTPTYAGDLAAAIYHIIEQDKMDRQGVYHFSNEGVCSWYDFAREICAMSGHVCEIRPCHSDEFPSKVRRPSFSVLDKTKIKETFDIQIPYWKDSLQKCMQELEHEA